MLIEFILPSFFSYSSSRRLPIFGHLLPVYSAPDESPYCTLISSPLISQQVIDCAWHPLGAGSFLAVLTPRSLTLWACHPPLSTSQKGSSSSSSSSRSRKNNFRRGLSQQDGSGALIACALRVPFSKLPSPPTSLAFGASHR